ncbi:cytochrome P450 [Xylogone sp. PMI_703]|nr:cytochrome P450 [Xylogone sp. PMI_703]
MIFQQLTLLVFTLFQSWTTYPVLISLAWFAWGVYSYFFHPYSDLPGPFWAKISRFWLVVQVLKGNIDKKQRELHRKYGKIVRIAPNEVSVSDPEAVRVIYSVNSGFTKTDFYNPFASHISPNEDLFTQRDEKLHAYRRKFVNNLYSLTSILESEQYVDDCTHMFITRMDEFAISGKSMDLGIWFQMYAFDVIGELFFGKQFGFMKDRHDYHDYIRSLDLLLPAVATTSVLPSYVRGIRILGHLLPPVRRALVCYNNIVKAAKEAVHNRQILMQDNKLTAKSSSDVLDKLFKISDEKMDFTVVDITTEAWVALFAGSDTTAIAMRAILYFLMKNPESYHRLVTEIDTAVKANQISDPVKYSEARKLPYFSACFKEAMRLHPSVGMTMPRHVPPSGKIIAGRFFPGGSRVGISASVLHLDKNIFGDDADRWNPDRWLGPTAEYMDRYMIHFGAGSRTCIGKNISITEIHKLLPSIIRYYRLELVHPEKEWETHNFWFNKQTGLNVKVTRRQH